MRLILRCNSTLLRLLELVYEEMVRLSASVGVTVQGCRSYSGRLPSRYCPAPSQTRRQGGLITFQAGASVPDASSIRPSMVISAADVSASNLKCPHERSMRPFSIIKLVMPFSPSRRGKSRMTAPSASCDNASMTGRLCRLILPEHFRFARVADTLCLLFEKRPAVYRHSRPRRY